MSSVTNPRSKRNKGPNFGAENDDVDFISDLPDDLICHILSFLPTKESVLTSILSNRWRPLWTLVPILNFDRNNHFPHAKLSTFLNFVSSALRRRHDSPIKRFRLLFGDDDFDFRTQSCINSWLAASTSNGVKTLHLELPMTLTVPRCVFTCKTLVRLTLNTLWGHDIADVSGLGLPSLKSLRIRSDQTYDCSVISTVLSVCPMLQRFLLRAILTARFPLSEYKKQLPINFSMLRAFRISVGVVRLHKTNVDEWLRYILMNLCNVKYLSLSRPAMQATANAGEGPSLAQPHVVPTCVSTSLRAVKFLRYHGNEDELDAVRYLHKYAKILKRVRICSVHTLNAEEKLQILSALPRCKVLFE